MSVMIKQKVVRHADYSFAHRIWLKEQQNKEQDPFKGTCILRNNKRKT